MAEGGRYIRYSALTVLSALFVGVGFYLLRILLYARLPPGEYAAVYAAMSLSQLVFPVLAFGLGPGLIPRIAEQAARGNSDGLRRTYAAAMTWELALCIAFIPMGLLYSESLARLFLPWLPAGGAVMRLTVLYTTAAVLTRSVMAALMGIEAVAWRTVAETTYVVVVLLGVLALTAIKPNARSALQGYLLGIAVMAVVARAGLALASRPFRRPVRPTRVLSTLAYILKQGKYLTVAVLGLMAFTQLDTVMLSAISGQADAVAGYQVAVPTAVILQTLLLAATQPLVPMAVSASTRGNLYLLAAAGEGVYRWAWTVLFPAAALMAVYGGEIMGVLFGGDLHGAPGPFAVLALSLPLYLLCWFNLQLLSGLNRGKSAAVAIAVGSGVNAALNAALIPWLGALGAALASAAGLGFGTLVSASALRKAAPLPLPGKAMILGAAAGAAAAAIALVIRQTVAFGASPLVAAVTASALLFCLSLGVLHRIGAARLDKLGTLLAGASKISDRRSGLP